MASGFMTLGIRPPPYSGFLRHREEVEAGGHDHRADLDVHGAAAPG